MIFKLFTLQIIKIRVFQTFFQFKTSSIAKIFTFLFPLQDYAPIPRTLSLADCINECTQVPNCKYWSYHQAQEKCFLKDNRNSKSSIDYLSKGYISGTRKCPTPKVPSIQTESHIEIGFSKFTFLPSTFGKQFRPGDKVSTVQ